MPQPAPAPEAKIETINIDANLIPKPKDAPPISRSAGDGVLFNAAKKCTVTFNPTDVFGASKDLVVGDNGPYYPAATGDVRYWINPSGRVPGDPNTGPYTIPVGS